MRLNHPVGAAAEARACAYFEARGFRIVARNWHCRFGEIDIIAAKANLTLFIEVKYRKSSAFGGALYSITPAKQAKLRQSIALWLQQHPQRGACRADALLFEGDSEGLWIENILDDSR